MHLPFIVELHPITGRPWMSIGHKAMAHRARYGGRRFCVPMRRDYPGSGLWSGK